jgi:two-component system NtrC family sensor kinase
VLVVEDEATLRDLHARFLEKLGLEVFLTTSGLEARDLLSSQDVDLVISDVKMPGEMNGITLYQWISDCRPALAQRFLFVTGDTQDPGFPALLASNPNRFVTKPFELQEYLRKVSLILAELPSESEDQRASA